LDTNAEILQKGRRRIQKLKLLGNFFVVPDLVNINIKTEIIQNLFETNSSLDANKLELFHMQYSDTLIALLEKIKKQKELVILNIITEINENKKYIQKFSQNQNTVSNFDTDRKYHNGYVSQILSAFYKIVTGSFATYQLTDAKSFFETYAESYFRRQAKIEYLLSEDRDKFYTFNELNVEKKLLSVLYQYNFKVRFRCGYLVENQIFELFYLADSDYEFIWNLQTNQFYFLPEIAKNDLNREKNENNSEDISAVLERRINALELQKTNIGRNLQPEVTELLSKYKNTIEQMDFFTENGEVAEETNILESMLNLNLNTNINQIQ